jgi:hypothetical protein
MNTLQANAQATVQDESSSRDASQTVAAAAEHIDTNSMSNYESTIKWLRSKGEHHAADVMIAELKTIRWLAKRSSQITEMARVPEQASRIEAAQTICTET